MHGFHGLAFGLVAVACLTIGGCLALSTTDNTGGTGGQGGFGETSSGMGLGMSGQPCMTVQDCSPAATCSTMNCVSGSCVAGMAAPGTQCNASGVCDGSGSCVECVNDNDCGGTNPTCTSNECISCSDGDKNGDETGVDCGGPKCTPCSGMACMSGNDCAMGLYCVDGVCCDAPCTDACKACNLMATMGKCSTLPKGTEDPTVCEMANACSGLSGQCLLKNGQPCMEDKNCVSDKCDAAMKICEP